jgi:hypothetical protein
MMMLSTVVVDKKGDVVGSDGEKGYNGVSSNGVEEGSGVGSDDVAVGGYVNNNGVEEEDAYCRQ